MLKPALLPIFLALFLQISEVRSQELEFDIAGFKFLSSTEQLPEDLLSSRSAVFTIVPDDKRGLRGDWKGMSEAAHQTLRSVGIDPVAYYNYQDLSAGSDASAIYAQLLKKEK